MGSGFDSRSLAPAEPPADGVGVLLQFAEALVGQVAGRGEPVGADGLEAAARRRDVVLTHLAVGVLPFAALPVLLAFGARPSGFGLAAFALMAAPAMAALDLARTGALERTLLTTSFAFCGLVAVVAAATGSPVALALLSAPLIDSALAGSRRALVGAGAAACAAVAGLLALALAGQLPGPQDDLAPSVALGAAASAYLVGLAARAWRAVAALDRLAGPNEAQFERFAATLDDLVTRHAPNGAVAYASPAARESLGALPRELCGDGLFQRVHIADRPAFLQTLASAVDGAEPQRVEIRLRRGGEGRAAAFRWVEMRARRIDASETGADSAAAAPVVATFRDIEALKAHEEALAEARGDAETSRLAKTRFLAHMSHELKTPLNSIIGFSEALADEALSRIAPERRADYAALIHRSGVHLLEIVDSILDQAKIESGAFAVAPRRCAVGPLVEQCVALLSMKADAAGVLLSADLTPDLPEVMADPRAVTQIVLNLAGNAVKFTPRGGAVVVSLAARRGGGLVLSVRDTGVGVAPEHLARLGEPFYQVEASDGSRDGAGLGLSVVRSLVALHGGAMSIDSALGRGTVVAIELPAGTARPRGETHDIEIEKVKRRA